MNITILGSGNVASVLGEVIFASGHNIQQVYSRSNSGKKLAERWNATYHSSWHTLSPGSSLYLVCLSDTALEVLARDWRMPHSFIAHTSGSVPMEVLQPISGETGVFYPLQSLSTDSPLRTEIPFLLEAADDDLYEILENFALSISKNIMPSTHIERLAYHLSAVFANNFSNALYHAAYEWCGKNDLSFEMLLPLIRQTALRLGDEDPAIFQTGPAVRNDLQTVERHKKLLEEDPLLLDIYSTMTKYIAYRIKKPT